MGNIMFLYFWFCVGACFSSLGIYVSEDDSWVKKPLFVCSILLCRNRLLSYLRKMLGSVLVLALAVWGFMFQKIIIGSKSLCLFALFCSVEIDCYRLTRESQRDYNVILSCFYNGLERIATYLGCYLFGAYILVLTFIRCHIFKLIYNNYLLYLFN
jgi:hypothetical protein